MRERRRGRERGREREGVREKGGEGGRDLEVWYIALAHRQAWCFADWSRERDI